MSSKTLRRALAFLGVLILAGCGGTFQSAQSLNTGSDHTPSGDPSNGAPTPEHPTYDPAWEKLQLEGSVNGYVFDKTPVLGLDKERKELLLRLPMLANPGLDGLTAALPIQRLPGARLTVEPLPNGRIALALRIPLHYVTRGVNFLPPARLPNGDPLPTVLDGELPSLAVGLSNSKKVEAMLYLAPTMVGIYVNTPFDPYIELNLPIRNSARTRVLGSFSLIPAKSGFDGGFFILIKLPDDIARTIDNNL